MFRFVILLISLILSTDLLAKPKTSTASEMVYLNCFSNDGLISFRIQINYKNGVITHTYSSGETIQVYGVFMPDVISYLGLSGQAFQINRSNLLLTSRLGSMVFQSQCKRSVATRTQI
jgi:hypothetical protein